MVLKFWSNLKLLVLTKAVLVKKLVFYQNFGKAKVHEIGDLYTHARSGPTLAHHPKLFLESCGELF